MEVVNEFDEFSKNITNITNEYEYTYKDYESIFMASFIMTAIARLAGDIILCLGIWKSFRPPTRTTSLLFMWAANDILSSLYVFVQTFTFEILLGRSTLHCVIEVGQDLFRFIGILLIIILITDWMIESKRISDRAIIIAVAVFSIFIAFIFTMLCMLLEFKYHFMMMNDTLHFLTFIVMLFKELVNCYRCYRGGAELDQTLRLGIGRIYVYCYFLVSIVSSLVFSFMFSTPLWAVTQILDIVVQNLISMNFLIYLSYKERKMRVFVMNFLRCKGIRYEDATMEFAAEGDDADI